MRVLYALRTLHGGAAGRGEAEALLEAVSPTSGDGDHGGTQGGSAGPAEWVMASEHCLMAPPETLALPPPLSHEGGSLTAGARALDRLCPVRGADDSPSTLTMATQAASALPEQVEQLWGGWLSGRLRGLPPHLLCQEAHLPVGATPTVWVILGLDAPQENHLPLDRQHSAPSPV